MPMPSAKLSFSERLLIETLLRGNVSREDICIRLGLATAQLQREIRRGWIPKEKRYDPMKAQLSLKA